jgi:GH24 family phage-related lysozyme (muramidase)
MFGWILSVFSARKKDTSGDNREKSVNAAEEIKPNMRTYQDYNWNPVIEFETGGRAFYESSLKKASWPGGQSGVTIGIGADLGYMSRQEFEKYFAKYFTVEEKSRLRGVIGIKGESAKNALTRVRDIQLSWVNASSAFREWTLPKFWSMANSTWPGLDQLCESAQVALVSIVFNRGGSLSGPSRVEMLRIKNLIPKKDYEEIARQIRLMKRLWVGKGLNGLLKRRDAEADMVLSCLKN